MNVNIELEAAHKRIAQLEDLCTRRDKELTKAYRVQALLIAAGFVSAEKIRQAEELLDSVD